MNAKEFASYKIRDRPLKLIGWKVNVTFQARRAINPPSTLSILTASRVAFSIPLTSPASIVISNLLHVWLPRGASMADSTRGRLIGRRYIFPRCISSSSIAYKSCRRKPAYRISLDTVQSSARSRIRLISKSMRTFIDWRVVTPLHAGEVP